MKGFEIHYKDKIRKVAILDGMVTVNIFQKENNARIFVGGIDYEEQEEIIWCNFSPMDIGDIIHIKIKEIDDFSIPEITNKDTKIKRPKTKLEMFRKLEANLQQRGLL